MTIICQNFTVFMDILHFCTVFKTWKVCTPNCTLKINFFAIHIITTFKVLKKNYFLSNFWLHICKSVWYRKLANICKSMQICKPFTKYFFFKCLSIFWGKMSLPQTVYFSISNFWYKLTQPTVYTVVRYDVYLQIV